MAGYSYAQAPLLLSLFLDAETTANLYFVDRVGEGGWNARLHLIGDGWSCGRLVVNLFILRLIATLHVDYNNILPYLQLQPVGLYHLPDFQIMNSSYQRSSTSNFSFSVYSYIAIMIIRNHSGCVLNFSMRYYAFQKISVV